MNEPQDENTEMCAEGERWKAFVTEAALETYEPDGAEVVVEKIGQLLRDLQEVTKERDAALLAVVAAHTRAEIAEKALKVASSTIDNPGDSPKTNNLYLHAVRELDLIGCDDSAFSGRKEVLEIIEIFSKQDHSGSSADWVLSALTKLLAYENLFPLTDESDDWIEVGEGLWQNRRNSRAFSDNGGVTYTMVDEGSGGVKRIYESEKSS